MELLHATMHQLPAADTSSTHSRVDGDGVGVVAVEQLAVSVSENPAVHGVLRKVACVVEVGVDGSQQQLLFAAVTSRAREKRE